ncbi:hypothetical protein ACOBQX_02765 [Actinokineospora sp. G85]|uniref:hypothetical protein n=1 Tax=Actinokineospora sp. G85 TaxID=3406626 RepID=UPI003C7203DE
MSEELNRERQEVVDLARFGLPQTVSGTPFPASQHGAPLVVDTDAGRDPAAAVALVLAAAEPSLALVVAVPGERARFVRGLLDSLGRSEVPVVPAAGELDAVAAVCAGEEGPVRWAALGPATALARVLTELPVLRPRIVATLFGGPDEINIAVDPEAAATVLTAAELPKLVLAHSAAGTPVTGELVNGTHRASLLVGRPSSNQGAALTLAAALQLPFVDLFHDHVAVTADGRLERDPAGHLVRVSEDVDLPAFRRWLTAGRRPTSR